jgi:hypothetical protein
MDGRLRLLLPRDEKTKAERAVASPGFENGGKQTIRSARAALMP